MVGIDARQRGEGFQGRRPIHWDETADQARATWRGSALISREVRAKDLPDYVTAGNAPSVDPFYTGSITRQRRFDTL